MFGKLKASITRSLVIRVLRGFAASGAMYLATNGMIEGSTEQAVAGAIGYILIAAYSIMASGTPPKVMLAQYAALLFAGILAGAGVLTPEQATGVITTITGSDAIGGTAALDLIGGFITLGTQVSVTKHNARKGLED
ncbi:MAG: hypothetical protein AB7Q29_13525 [Vicinamibacterales bacterium]